MLKNTEDSYGSLMRGLHWLIALLIIGMICLGFSFDFITNKALEGSLIQWHKSFGLTVLMLMVIRYAWRLSQIIPQLPHNTPIWQKFGAHAVQWLLYLLAFLMPISGWIMSTAGGHSTRWFFLFTLNAPGISKNKAVSGFFYGIHHYGAWVLSALIVLHIAGAVKHHYIDRDNVFNRMWRGEKVK